MKYQRQFGLIFAILIFAFQFSFTQSPIKLGQEAQSLDNVDLQSQNETKILGLETEQEIRSKETTTDRSWIKKFERYENRLNKHQRKHPNRPIPAVLLVLGSILLFIWLGLLIITILAAGSVAGFLLLLILTILFSPLAILGIILIIGGIVGSAV